MVPGSLQQACLLWRVAVPSLEMLVLFNKQEELLKSSAFLLELHPLRQIQTVPRHLVCFKAGTFIRKEIRLPFANSLKIVKE